jgi:hypothetical protein
MKILPAGRREWYWVGLQLVVVSSLIAIASCYVKSMPGHSYQGPLPPLSEDELLIRDHIKDFVAALAGNIGQRNVGHYDSLRKSEALIETRLKDLGYEVSSQDFEVSGKTVRNLEAELRGTGETGELVVVGAHYDSVNSPGADNASGVSALIEIARLLSTQQTPRTIRFVAFVNEEPPYFQTEDMGSRRYAARLRQEKQNVVAMYSLETIGYYSDAEGSQRYPFPFAMLYPTRGNFIGFVGNTSSRPLVRRSIKVFRDATRFPSEGIAAPGSLTGIGWSDQWSFWQEDYPAVMITDTALFRYRYYHTLSDSPERLDYDRMSRVVPGIARVIVDAAGGNP